MDKLLLGLIDANLSRDLSWETRRRRRERSLFAAKKALLFGNARNAQVNDRVAIFYMADEWHKDHVIDPRTKKRVRLAKARSIRTLADEAAAFTTGNSVSSIAERLRSKFKKDREEYLALVRFGDDVEQTMQRGTLQKVRELLAVYKIEFEIDGDLLAAPPVKKRQAKFASEMRQVKT